MSFFIAMQNRRATARHLHPQTFTSARNEFLIVSRSGGRNEFLSISNAGDCTGQEEEAPAELKPDAVLHATLVAQGPDGGEIFVVERQKRKGHVGEGRHLGGDGYILLHQAEDRVSLTGAVRLRPGVNPRPAGNLPGATVRFDAAYVPWSGERLPAGFNQGCRTRFGVV
ncbi:hypothetical protein DEA8626_01054 [Defluviimonas aquaemixtae]|uniref:Uncharacterized protein n=1 Tax=Albidovulum aquaemixtae TaxID=1542388 RepID=A0A2R8B4J1_9RHOB|nr:hypothetical protein [Defluviimonas aquaemixtae]SPH17531.1 hypothetical protein DEA8626_01054 [Defluviimonas aquaemixtae]